MRPRTPACEHPRIALGTPARSASHAQGRRPPARAAARCAQVAPRAAAAAGLPPPWAGRSSARVARHTALEAPEELVGWRVFKYGSSGAFLGTIEDVSVSGNAALSPPLVSVVNSSPAGVSLLPGLREKHVIPFVREIFVALDPSARQATVRPPAGLLQLGRKRLMLDIIAPRLLEVAAKTATASTDSSLPLPLGRTLMPSRAQLEALGEARLIKGIARAGGFTEVAHRLGLKTSRAKVPNGYWENLDNLDVELSLFVASQWVEERLPGAGEPCFFNPIVGRRQWVAPQAPTRIPLDDEGTVLLAEDERDRVMPSHAELVRAGRYDLRWAVHSHGGYRAVAEALDRAPSWPKRRVARGDAELVRELRAAQRELCGGGGRLPTAGQLRAAGRRDLEGAISRSGGFHRAAALAGLTPTRNARGCWDDIDTVAALLTRLLASGELAAEPGCFPTQRQLLACCGHRLAWPVKVHGSAALAARMGLQLRRPGRKPGSDAT